MNYRLELLPDAPVLLQTFSPGFSMVNEGMDSIRDIEAMLATLTEPIFVINDMTDSAPKFDDLLHGSNMLARQTELLKHPMVRAMIMVSPSRLIELAAKGMNTPIFGNQNIPVFKTVDDALEYVKGQV